MMAYYVWIFLSTFLDSNVTLYSALATFGAAFGLTILFPPATFLLFGAALAVSGGMYLYNAGKHHEAQQQLKQLEEELQRISTELEPLKKDLETKKKASADLITQITHARETKYYLACLAAYRDMLYNKLMAMTPEEKQTYLQSHEGISVTNALAAVNGHNLTAEQMVAVAKQLETAIKPSFTHAAWTQFLHDHHIHEQPSTAAALKAHHHATPVQEAAIESGYKPRSITSIAAKTAFFSFAFTLSIVAIISAITLAATPAGIFITMPLIALGVSALILTACVGLGLATAVFYKKVIEPQERAAAELPVKLEHAHQETLECRSEIHQTEQKNLQKTERLHELEHDVHEKISVKNQRALSNLKEIIAPNAIPHYEHRELLGNVHRPMKNRAAEALENAANAEPELPAKPSIDNDEEMPLPGEVPH